MNKNILRNGDMVLMANGKKATYMNIGGTPIFRYHTDKGSFSYVNKYSDDLIHPTNSAYNVEKIYRVSDGVDAKDRNDAIFNPDKMADYGELIADRSTSGYVPAVGYSFTDIDAIADLNDTRTGDMVEFANGKFATVFRDMPNGADCVKFHTAKNSFMPFTRFVGLNHFKRPEYNIVKIYRADDTADASTRYDVIGNPDKMTDYGNVIYSRVDDDQFYSMTIENCALDDDDTKRTLLEALGATVQTINALLGRLS